MVAPIAVDIFVTPGQIEFHGGTEPTTFGPSTNLVEGNCLDGDIKYYQGDKGPNLGGDFINFNTCNGNPIGSSDIKIGIGVNVSFFPSTSCSSTYYPQKPVWWPNWISFPCGNLCNSDIISVDCSFRTREPSMSAFGGMCGNLYVFNNSSLDYDFTGVLPGRISITPNGGTPPYQVNISGTNVYGNPINITRYLYDNSDYTEDGLFEGSYTVTLIDAMGKPQPALSSRVDISCINRYFRDGMEILVPFSIIKNTDNGKSTSMIKKGQVDSEVEGNTNSGITTTNDTNDKKSDKNLDSSSEIVILKNSKKENIQLFNRTLKAVPLNLMTYPNPMTNYMTIRYQIEEDDVISINLVNNIGQVVRVIENQTKRIPGIYEVSFDRRELSNGIYFGVLTSKNHKYNFKVVVQ